MEETKCRYCHKTGSLSELTGLCDSCSYTLPRVAANFDMTLDEVIKSVWSYGPDRKGFTTYYKFNF